MKILAKYLAGVRISKNVRRSAWYDLYDESGKKYKTLSEFIGSFVSVSGDTFVIRRSAWLDTYDRFGKKINTRSAR